jgi:hypothetical protein
MMFIWFLIRLICCFGSRSGSVTSSYGSGFGSGSCKKFRILKDPDWDPDPQHCCTVLYCNVFYRTVLCWYCSILFLFCRYRYFLEVFLYCTIVRVSTEVTFWNAAECGILCGSDFNSAEFRGSSEYVIPRNSAKFRACLYTEFHIYFCL